MTTPGGDLPNGGGATPPAYNAGAMPPAYSGGAMPPAYGGSSMPPEHYGAPASTQVPKSLATAIKLMYVGAALSLINAFMPLFLRGEVRKAVEDANAKNIGKKSYLDPSQVDTAVTVGIVSAVVVGLIAVGLWLLMAALNKRGLGWARIVATVLAAISLLQLVTALSQASSTGIGSVLGVLTSIVGIAAAVMLWRKDSSAFYDAHK